MATDVEQANIVENIKSRGHWDVSIRPELFVKTRIPKPTDLYSIVERSKVRLRGWDYPHLDDKVHIRGDHIWQDFHWDMYLEAMRFYQSGLFVHLAGLAEDWRDVSGFWPKDKEWRPGSDLSIERTVFRATEIFEFASRLSQTPAGDETMHIEVKLVGLEGRRLSVDGNRMPFFPDKVAEVPEYEMFEDAIPRTDLIARARDLAVQACASLFHQFNWDTDVGVLRDVQQQLGRFL